MPVWTSNQKLTERQRPLGSRGVRLLPPQYEPHMAAGANSICPFTVQRSLGGTGSLFRAGVGVGGKLGSDYEYDGGCFCLLVNQTGKKERVIYFYLGGGGGGLYSLLGTCMYSEVLDKIYLIRKKKMQQIYENG